MEDWGGAGLGRSCDAAFPAPRPPSRRTRPAPPGVLQPSPCACQPFPPFPPAPTHPISTIWPPKQVVRPSSTLVAIHDSARPLVKPEHVHLCLQDAAQVGAAVLGVQAKATIKEVDGALGVVRTLRRDALWEVQTPQVIAPALLRAGFDLVRRLGLEVTDDVSIVEALGEPVRVTSGSYTNIKVCRGGGGVGQAGAGGGRGWPPGKRCARWGAMAGGANTGGMRGGMLPCDSLGRPCAACWDAHHPHFGTQVTTPSDILIAERFLKYDGGLVPALAEARKEVEQPVT